MLVLGCAQPIASQTCSVVCRGDVRGQAVTPLLDPRGCPPGPQMLPAASYGHETVCQASLGWREAGLPGFVGERKWCRWDPKHMRAKTQGRRGNAVSCYTVAALTPVNSQLSHTVLLRIILSN